MFRLLALLQLTRAALAFTAIADAWTVVLLREPDDAPQPMGLLIARMIVMAVVSFGLYGFGMALNDLLDARRDRLFAPRRPIPSGRIQPRWAVVTALFLLMCALLAAAFLTPLNLIARVAVGVGAGGATQPWTGGDLIPWSFLFAFITAALVVFYDATSKYLGGIGLVSLGAIRALHCLIGNPKSPLLWLSMILLTHVIIISALCYGLENKRPRLRWRDVAVVVLGIVVGDGLALFYMHARGSLTMVNAHMLIGPAIAAAVYAAWAWSILARIKLSPRQKGERLMLLGLFWLFIYDASMLLSNGQVLASLAITLLLLCAILSFFTIRFLSRMNSTRISYRAERATPASAAHASLPPAGS